MMKVTLITPESYPKEKPVDGFWEENNDRDNMESMMKKDGDGVEVFNGQDDSDDSEYDDVQDRNCMMDMYNGNSDSGDEISANNMKSHILKENNNNVAWEKCKDKMMPKQQLPEQQTLDDFNDSRMKAPFHSYTSDGEVSKSSTPASSSKDIPAQQVSHIPANLLFSEEAINLSVHKDNDSDDDDQSESVVENDSEEREEVPVQITNDQTHHSKPENGSNVVVIMPEDPSGATSRAFESSTNPRSSMKIFNKKDKSKRSFEKRPQGEESGHVVRAPMVPIPVMPEGFFSHHSFLAAQSSNAYQQKRKRKGIPEYVPDLTKKKPREYEDSEIEQSNGMSPRDVKLNIKEENDAASKKPLPVDPHLAMWSQLWNPYYFMNMAALHNLQQQQGALNGLMPIAPAPKSPLEPPQKHSPAGKAPPIVCHPPGTPVNLSTRAEPLRSTTDSEAENQPQEEAINLSVKRKPVTSTPSSSTSSSHLAPLDLRPGITDSPIGRGGGGGLHPAFEQVKNWARGYQSGSPSPSTHPGYAPGSEPIRKGCTRTRERWRVTYNEVQTNALEMEFQFNRFVHRQRRYDLSREIGLTERQIKIWFQNRRMKQKKEDKKRLIDKEFNEHTKTTLLEDIKFIMSPGAVASKGEGSSSALGSPGDSSFQKALSEEAESPIARESPSRSLEAGEEEEEGALSS